MFGGQEQLTRLYQIYLQPEKIDEMISHGTFKPFEFSGISVSTKNPTIRISLRMFGLHSNISGFPRKLQAD